MLSSVRRLCALPLELYSSSRYRAKQRILSGMGVNPFYSHNAKVTPEQAMHMLNAHAFLVPNLSGFYHGTLRRWWEQYGLGNSCLLVSETRAVGDVFAGEYPKTKFVSTDFYVDLQPSPQCDVVWDLCSQSVPERLIQKFDSVICQATLEHVIDPVQVMRNLSHTLKSGGLMYIQTHTPGYHYHAYPEDHVRYFPDWFKRIAEHLKTLELVELLCANSHAFAVYRKTH